MSQKSLDVRAETFFLSRDELYQTEKLYRLQEPSDALPRTNVKTDKINDLQIRDLRGKEHEYTFEEQGFAVLQMESALTYEEFSDPQKVEDFYLEELGACLLKYMKGSSIQFFDRVVSVSFPVLQALSNTDPCSRRSEDVTQHFLFSRTIRFLLPTFSRLC